MRIKLNFKILHGNMFFHKEGKQDACIISGITKTTN